MFGRFFSLLLLLLCGATLGYFWAQSQELHSAFYLVLGGLVGAMLWWFWDAIRGLRVVYWLRYGNLAEVPSTFGLWGTVVDRTRRLLRERERAMERARTQERETEMSLSASRRRKRTRSITVKSVRPLVNTCWFPCV